MLNASYVLFTRRICEINSKNLGGVPSGMSGLNISTATGLLQSEATHTKTVCSIIAQKVSLRC